MYNKVMILLGISNIGSLVKEEICNNNLIKKDEDMKYYSSIIKILLSWTNTRKKEKELIAFLKSS